MTLLILLQKKESLTTAGVLTGEGGMCYLKFNLFKFSINVIFFLYKFVSLL